MLNDGKILAIDMGGTKTNLGVFPLSRSGWLGVLQGENTICSLINADFESPEQLLLAGLHQLQCGPVDIAVAAVAGPVTKGRASLTNLAWSLDAAKLQVHFGWQQLHLINDLEAMALGVTLLPHDRLLALNSATMVKKGLIAVMAAGTGLGEAFATWCGGRYTAHPGEGGHADFAPTDSLQIELLRFLMENYGHVSYERVCSGAGLWNIYQFLRRCRKMAEPEWLVELLREEQQHSRIIVAAAAKQDPACEICRQAIRILLQVLGAVAGNLALRLLPVGGLFISGGLAQGLAGFFKNSAFRTAYLNKGRLSAVAAGIPVFLVCDAFTPLYGCVYYGWNVLGGGSH